LEWAVFISVLSAISVISGLVITWQKMFRKFRIQVETESSEKARAEENLQANLNYIRMGIDEVRLEQKDQGRRFDSLSERVTRVEESAKQAHKRIDRLDGGRTV